MYAKGIPVICAAFACSVLLLTGCNASDAPSPAADGQALTLGVGREPLSALAYVAEHEGLFEANGLDVAIVDYSGGGTAHAALLDGTVDVALCTDTPLVIGALRGTPITIAATVASNPNDITLLARKSAGIASAADLRGKRVGVQPGTAADFFLHSFLGLNGMSHDDVSIVSGTHTELAASLIAGELDVAALREPQTTDVIRAIGDDLLVFEEPGLYVKTSNLCFDPDRPVDLGALTRLLRALVQAEDLMAGERAGELTEVVAERIGSDPGSLDPASHGPGSVSLRQAFILSFEDQARWALAEGLVPDATVFDALALIDPRALDAVSPDRVSVIR